MSAMNTHPTQQEKTGEAPNTLLDRNTVHEDGASVFSHDRTRAFQTAADVASPECARVLESTANAPSSTLSPVKHVRSQSLLTAFYVAARGILYCIIHERNMKIHLGCALIVLIAGFIVSLSMWEWCVCLVCIALVCALECMNTALEACVDLATARYHKLARIAKDAAAGSVLVAAFFSLIIGLLIFVPHILH